MNTAARQETLAKMAGDIEGMLPELENIYKDLHANPELSMQEVRTPVLPLCSSRNWATKSMSRLASPAW